MGNTNRICSVLLIEREGSMQVIQLDGQLASIRLTKDDIEVLEKYARREEIDLAQSLQEAFNNGIEEIAFKKD